MKNLPPYLKGACRVAENKARRLQRAAELSQSKSAAAIMRELGISDRTLKRYVADPRWQEYGGNSDLAFPPRGRPKRHTLSVSEKRTLAEMDVRYERLNRWEEVADEMGLPIDRIKYLLRKRKQ